MHNLENLKHILIVYRLRIYRYIYIVDEYQHIMFVWCHA